MNLNTEEDLAVVLGISTQQAQRFRRDRKWPHVRISRNEVRYTDEQIAQIVMSMIVRPKLEEVPVGGRTKRSAARRSA